MIYGKDIAVICSNTLSIILPDTSVINFPTPTITSPYHTCTDSLNNIWAVSQGGNLFKISPLGVILATIFIGGNPLGVCRDSLDNIYVGEYNNKCVYKINAGTTTISSTISLGYSPWGMCCDSLNNLYVACSTSGLFKVNAGTTSVYSSTSCNGTKVCCDSKNNVYACSINQTLIKAPLGNLGSAISINVGFNPWDVCCDSLDNVYASNYDTVGGVGRINAGATTVSTIIGVPNNPTFVFCDYLNNLYVVASGGISKILAGSNVVSSTIKNVGNGPQGMSSFNSGFNSKGGGKLFTNSILPSIVPYSIGNSM